MSDGDYPLVEINVVPLQAAYLADAHASEHGKRRPRHSGEVAMRAYALIGSAFMLERVIESSPLLDGRNRPGARRTPWQANLLNVEWRDRNQVIPYGALQGASDLLVEV